MSKSKSIIYGVIAAFIILALTPLAAYAAPAQPGSYEVVDQGGGPTATPQDPVWLAFAAARSALEDKVGGDFTYVQNWTFEEFEFVDGIDSCHALAEGETERQVYWGWRFVITSMGGLQYEVRSSFNYQIISVCDKVTQVAAAATAATTASGAPAPVAGTATGGSFEAGGQVMGLSAGTRNALSTAGLKWVKYQAQVGQDFTGLINEAHGAGFKVLLSVIGDKSQVMNSGYQDTYAAYVAGLAKSGADAIEIWNEMNIDREWPAGQINGANYVPLLAKSFNAIKTANANTLVISGALSPTGFFGAAGCTSAGCNDDVYTQQMAAAGAGNYADCIGVHYNEGIVSPTQSTGDPRDNYPTRYFGTMLNRAIGPFGGKQACFTELGFLSPEGYGALPGNFAWAAETSASEHATWLAQAAVAAAATGKVRLMIIFNVDFTTWTATDPMAGYAIIRPGGGCPACSTLAGVLK